MGRPLPHRSYWVLAGAVLVAVLALHASTSDGFRMRQASGAAASPGQDAAVPKAERPGPAAAAPNTEVSHQGNSTPKQKKLSGRISSDNLSASAKKLLTSTKEVGEAAANPAFKPRDAVEVQDELVVKRVALAAATAAKAFEKSGQTDKQKEKDKETAKKIEESLPKNPTEADKLFVKTRVEIEQAVESAKKADSFEIAKKQMLEGGPGAELEDQQQVQIEQQRVANSHVTRILTISSAAKTAVKELVNLSNQQEAAEKQELILQQRRAELDKEPPAVRERAKQDEEAMKSTLQIANIKRYDAIRKVHKDYHKRQTELDKFMQEGQEKKAAAEAEATEKLKRAEDAVQEEKMKEQDLINYESPNHEF